MCEKKIISQCPICNEYPKLSESGVGCNCISIIGKDPNRIWRVYKFGARLYSLLCKKQRLEDISHLAPHDFIIKKHFSDIETSIEETMKEIREEIVKEKKEVKNV